MSIIRRYSYSFKQKALEKMMSLSNTRDAVLTFHIIARAANSGVNSLGYDAFCDFTTMFRKRIVPIESLVMDNRVLLGMNNIYLTFDDCDDSVYRLAFPFMCKNNLPFTVFVCLEYLNQPGYLSTSMIDEMLSSGLCTIGSHGLTHSVYRFLSPIQVYMEMKYSKMQFERIFGVEVDFFAYPYGSLYAISKDDLAVANGMGYVACFGTLKATLSSSSVENQMYLPRLHVNDETIGRIVGCLSH